MTPQAQRIAIAKACGYSAEMWACGAWMLLFQGKKVHHPLDGTSSREAAFLRHAPDYLNDLNAMREALGTLGCEMQNNFAHVLSWVVIKGRSAIGWYDLEPHEVFAVANATAAQFAEAFLRTIGKWEDGQ